MEDRTDNAALEDHRATSSSVASDQLDRDGDTGASAHTIKRSQAIAEGFRNRTKGEALFNKISYIGVGYFLVTGVSIFMTWLLGDTARISPKFNAWATKLAKKFGQDASIVNIVTLFIGGTIASVLPVKWLESRKPDLVKKFDHLYYTDDQIKHDPTIQAAYQELDALPKQTWLSVLSSRIVAFVATFSVFFLMGSKESPVGKMTGHSIDGVAIKIGRGVDKLLHRNNPKLLGEIEAAAAQNIKSMTRDAPHPDRLASRIWNYIALDGFYTAITGSALFIFTRIFGGLWGKETPTNATVDISHPATPHHDEHTAARDLPQPANDRTALPGTVPPPYAAPLPLPANDLGSPRPQIAQPSYVERLAAPAPEHHLTA